MKQLQELIHYPKVRVLILLILLNAFLLFSIILPTMEKAPYYQNKIKELKQNKDLMATYALHIDYYRNKIKQSSHTLSVFKQKVEQLRQPTFINQSLNSLMINYDVQLLDQTLEVSNLNPDFEIIDVHLTVEGTFENLLRYLEAVELTNPYFIISSCQFDNSNPLETNPTLTLELRIKCFFPKSVS